MFRCSGDVMFSSCPQLHQELERWEQTPIWRLVLDCESVRFLDSTGIGCLNGAARFAAVHGCSFALRPSADAERVLRIAGRADLMG